jgi:single-stranded-DNA-specific exonuclease
MYTFKVYGGGMRKVWEIKERTHKDIVKQLLENRGVLDEAGFLEPDFDKDLLDSTKLPDFEVAAERIIRAKERGETIGIFADYDADGIPGAAFFKKALDKIGIKSEVYIPSRDEGYGLQEVGIDLLISKGCRLIVSIDLGIRDFNAAKHCKRKKIDLIITDHHVPGDKKPEASAVINPKLKGSNYKFDGLSGAGVIFKFVVGLAKYFPEIDEKFLKWNLDLIAVSTISDVCSLINENRVIAKFGLKVLRKTKNIGLQELYKAAGIDPEKIESYTVGFQIGPRINAPGRIDHATKSYQLLTIQDRAKARELAQWLNQKNEERQKLMDDIFKEAEAKIKKDRLDKNKIIVLFGQWQKGVLGPTASQIVEKYARPTILFSHGEEYLVGSARSVEGVDILKIFDGVSRYIEKYGGHKGAAGITIKKSRKDDFTDKIIEFADQNIDDKDLVKKIKIDVEIKLDEISMRLYDIIEKLMPFGMGNPKPVFASEGVNLLFHRRVGREENHLSLKFEKDGKEFRGICFGFEDCSVTEYDSKKYNIAYQIIEDNWNGSRELKLQVLDIKAIDG